LVGGELQHLFLLSVVDGCPVPGYRLRPGDRFPCTTVRLAAWAGIGMLPYPGSLDSRPASLPGLEETRGTIGTARHTGVHDRAFVGRARELALLGDLLERAVGGDVQLAVIGGDAGVGKTRLAAQLAAAATARGMHVLRGGCVPLGEEGLPFAPVIDALRDIASQLDPATLAAVIGPAHEQVGRLINDPVGNLDAVPGGDATEFGRGRLFELLLGVVERLSTEAPLLLVMEDLHWADRVPWSLGRLTP
jgi:hypothetical protein